MGFGEIGEPGVAICDRPKRMACLWQPIAPFQRHERKPRVPDRIAHPTLMRPDGGKRFGPEVDHAADAGFEADIERIAQALAVPEIGVF